MRFVFDRTFERHAVVFSCQRAKADDVDGRNVGSGSKICGRLLRRTDRRNDLPEVSLRAGRDYRCRVQAGIRDGFIRRCSTDWFFLANSGVEKIDWAQEAGNLPVLVRTGAFGLFEACEAHAVSPGPAESPVRGDSQLPRYEIS